MSSSSWIQENDANTFGLEVSFQRLSPGAKIPTYATQDSAGADLYACLEKSMDLLPGEHILIPTGLALALPKGWEGQIRPRSGLAAQYGVTVLNSPGTIDADYRGEIKILLIHLGKEPFKITPAMRIAQLVVSKIYPCRWQEAASLDLTRRNEGGFGSTGF